MRKELIIKKLDPIKPSVAYDTYWKFAFKRQEVFFKRFNGNISELTEDEILLKYKFTNAYRASDRVSQYLIKNVIYNEDFSYRDIFLRIILFKLFNKIETWELLEKKFGLITENTFKTKSFSHYLNKEMDNGRVLYSNAYMMASGSKEFNVTRKHQAHLLLVDKMMRDNLPDKLCDTSKMREGYDLMLSYPMIGTFLAYQYITDINYSEITNYSEKEFTIPGPGAKDGIRKCFIDLGGLTEVDIIKLMFDRQEFEFERLNLPFRKLGNRKLQYIDIQNIFCETDKYARVAHPNISGISGRTRIKQKFKPNHKAIDFFYPPKWNINLKEFK